MPSLLFLYIFFKDFIDLFLERGEMRERQKQQCERETLISCPLQAPQLGETCNPGMCPDQESSQRPFALWGNAQPAEPCLSGLYIFVINVFS